MTSVIKSFSTNTDFTPYQLIAEITARGYFETIGNAKTSVLPFEQSVDELIEAFHSRNGLSRERMTDGGAEFGASIKRMVTPYANNGSMNLGTYSTITWGKLI